MLNNFNSLPYFHLYYTFMLGLLFHWPLSSNKQWGQASWLAETTCMLLLHFINTWASLFCAASSYFICFFLGNPIPDSSELPILQTSMMLLVRRNPPVLLKFKKYMVVTVGDWQRG